MRTLLAITTLIIGAIAPRAAIACTVVLPADPRDPSAVQEFADRVQRSAVVVLARPIEIKRTPLRPEGRYLSLGDPYQQVVLWRVLYSWKGSAPGDDFQTTSKIVLGDPCVGWSIIASHEPRIVYASGSPPYSYYYSVQVSGAERDLMHLQDKYNPVQVL